MDLKPVEVSGMKIQTIVTATLIAVLFTGCAGTSPTPLFSNSIGIAREKSVVARTRIQERV